MDDYYDEQQGNYSDDFEEDDSEVRVTSKPPQPPTLTPKRATFKEKSSTTSRKAKSHHITRKRTSWKEQGNRGRTLSESKASKAGNYSFMSSPRDRELSAKQHALRKTENDLVAAKRELDELKKENRLLNRLQVRQEKQLNKIQTQEGELPQILARHAEEVRVLKEQVKRCQEISQSYQHKVNDLRQEMLRINDRKKKLEEIARRRQLLERETLTIQLHDTQSTLKDRDTKITELERGMDAMGKNHQQEVRLLKQKNKALAHENEQLRNTTQKLNAQYKDKEKELEVLNIYSQRFSKNMPRNTTRLQAPITDDNSSQTDLSCPPNKLVSLQSKPSLKSSSSQTDLPPQDKPHPQPKRRDSKICSTQTDIVVNPKNETLLVTLSPEAFQATDNEPTKQPVSIPEKTTSTATSTDDKLQQQMQQQQTQQQQKKELLLSKLKAMDAQKGPPASQPVSSNVTKSSVEHTVNMSVNNERTNDPPAPVKPQATPQTAINQEPSEIKKEAQRKKLLMAKLMAIDEGNKPNDITVSNMDVSKNTGVKSTIKRSSANQSKSSLQSWPDTVENMYHGKPAHATEDDPFGSRHNSGNKPLRKKESGLLNKEPPQPQIHKASFGRRAAGPIATGVGGSKPRNGMIFGGLEDNDKQPNEPLNPFTFEVNNKRDYPWETRVNISSQTTTRDSTGIGGGKSLLLGSSGNPGSLLPLRPKAEASSFIAEPDDLEELSI